MPSNTAADPGVNAKTRDILGQLDNVLDIPQGFKTWILDFVPLYSTILQDAIATAAATISGEPHFIGEPFMWLTSTPPDLSVFADGTDYAEVDYPEAFDVFGNTFDTYRGQADPGAGRFRVPKYDGLTLVGFDSGDSLFNSVTDQGGSKNAIVVSHDHTISPDPHSHDFATGTTASAAGQGTLLSGAGASAGNTTSLTVSTEGASGTNANIQPYGVVRFCVFMGR